jgi:hypothetical protein
MDLISLYRGHGRRGWWIVALLALLGGTTIPPVAVRALPALVSDSSFEGGTPNPAWSEGSTAFGTPLCNIARCGNGLGAAGPRTGSWWVWFGGTQSAETGFVAQSIGLPAGTATLQFYLRYGRHSGNGASDYLRVLANGNELWRIDDSVTDYDAGYITVTLDLTAYTSGTLQLRFEQHNAPAATIPALNLDDVTISLVPAPVYGATLTTAAPSRAAAPGTPVDYALTLTNTGTTTDTFDLTLGPQSWTTSITPTQSGPLAVGQTTPVTVTVQIPPAAHNADVELTTIQVDSVASAFSSTATLTTTALIDQRRLYLPLIVR